MVMAEDLITMEDMAAIFEVTDALGIHRESVRVELNKKDPGSIQRVADGMVEITLPVNESAEIFCKKATYRPRSHGVRTGRLCTRL